MAKAKQKTADIAVIAVVSFIIGTAAGYVIFTEQAGREMFITPSFSGEKGIAIGIPTVDANNNGVLGKLTTVVKPGSGQVLVNVVNLITLGNTQQSAQEAVKAAEKYTRINTSSTDIIFSIDVNASSIEGPSAGASMAVSVVLGLKNETPKPNVMMTGTIDQDENIGPVGSVFEKAKAAKAGGATIFLVPQGESTMQETTKTRQCRQVSSGQFCEILYTSKQANIGQALNMTVIEVGNLGQAVKYFE